MTEDNSSLLTGALSGAASGASMGSVAGPWGTVIGGVLGAGVGLISANEKNKDRPEYKIPQEVYQNLSLAEKNALVGLPEEQVQQYLSRLDKSQAYALSNMTDTKSGLAGVAAINQQQNNALADLRTADAAARKANEKELMNQRQIVADYTDQKYQLNQLNPYYEGVAKQQAQQGAALDSINNLLNTGVGLASLYGGSKYSTKQAKKDYNDLSTESKQTLDILGSNPSLLGL